MLQEDGPSSLEGSKHFSMIRDQLALQMRIPGAAESSSILAELEELEAVLHNLNLWIIRWLSRRRSHLTDVLWAGRCFSSPQCWLNCSYFAPADDNNSTEEGKGAGCWWICVPQPRKHTGMCQGNFLNHGCAAHCCEPVWADGTEFVCELHGC